MTRSEPDFSPLGEDLPPPMPEAKGWLAFLGRAYFRLVGWQMQGGGPRTRKAVIIAAPHTSNWDLVQAVAVAWRYGIRLKWIGKDSLFKVPGWGAFLKKMGGIPVDRSSPHGVVGAAAAELRAADELFLMVPPEGTRSKASGWKTGFYWIAHEAKVPIILGYLDYARKRASFDKLFTPTGDIERDFLEFRAFYQGVKGKFPAQQSEVRVQAKRTP